MRNSLCTKCAYFFGYEPGTEETEKSCLLDMDEFGDPCGCESFVRRKYFARSERLEASENYD